MNNLKKYLKPEYKGQKKYVVTSVNLDKSHIDFLRENNLNLSLLIRDFVESLIKETILEVKNG
jgi:hypothetical protein